MILSMTFFTYLLECGLAAILITAGAAKLAGRRQFEASLLALGVPMRPHYLVTSLAYGTAILELSIGAFVVIHRAPIIANLASTLMFTIFTLTTLWALMRKVDSDCRCFGAIGTSSFTWRGVVRNSLLMVIALFVLWYRSTNEAVSNLEMTQSALVIVGFGVLAVAAAQAATTLATLEEIKEMEAT